MTCDNVQINAKFELVNMDVIIIFNTNKYLNGME